MEYRKKRLDTDTVLELLGPPFQVGIPVRAADSHRIEEPDTRAIDIRGSGPKWAKWDCLDYESYRLRLVEVAKKAYSEGWEPAMMLFERLESLRFSLQCFLIKDDADSWEIVTPCVTHCSAFYE